MVKEGFIDISIRGRVAFSIQCLENALIHFEIEIGEWRLLLKHLWEYTDAEFVDEWMYLISEMLPEHLLEFDTYEAHDFEYIKESEFEYLYNLYSGNNFNDTLGSIISIIYKIGTCDVYERFENISKESLDYIEKLIVCMSSNCIDIPDSKKFNDFLYSEGGYGLRFDGKAFSCVL